MLIFETNVFDICSLPSAFHLLVHFDVMGGVKGQPTRICIYIPSYSCPTQAGKWYDTKSEAHASMQISASAFQASAFRASAF